MAASIETQRLISMSLGKIAQSRGQRGGINLHKNLLVATVLHKARTAYMMETYNFQQQQQQTLQRQKLQQEQFLLQQQQAVQQQNSSAVCNVAESPASAPSAARDDQVCQASADSELGHASVPSTASSSSASARSSERGSQIFVPPSRETIEEDSHEPMTVQECEAEAAAAAAVLDKENSPPTQTQEARHPVPENSDVPAQRGADCVSGCDHIAAATKLSQEAQQFGLASVAASESSHSPCQKQQQNSTSGSPTCNGILKRRRENFNAPSSDSDCPVVSKKARVSHDSSSLSHARSSSILVSSSFSSDMSDYSSDESDSESEAELTNMHTSDSTQISNLVNIFNCGFSGLCSSPSDSSGQDTGFQSDYEISSSPSPQYTSLTKLRPETPTPGSFSRKMSEPSLMCSSEVGRLDSLPSAIVLSA